MHGGPGLDARLYTTIRQGFYLVSPTKEISSAFLPGRLGSQDMNPSGLLLLSPLYLVVSLLPFSDWGRQALVSLAEQTQRLREVAVRLLL